MPSPTTPSAEPKPHKKLLILGGTGKLARLMRATLAQDASLMEGWQPVWAGRSAQAGVDVVITDTTSEFPQADAVLALWGVVPGGGDIALNTDLAHRAVEIAKQSGAKHVLHCSSSAVYGPGQSLSEISELRPANEYGAAKIAMENTILDQQRSDDLTPRSSILRLANVVGADSLFAAITRGGRLKLDQFEDGTSPRRSYATPRSVWMAVRGLLDSETPVDIVNVATATPVAMHDVLEAAEHPFDWQPAPEAAIAEVSLDVSVLQGLTTTDLHVTAAQMIEEWRAVRDVLR